MSPLLWLPPSLWVSRACRRIRWQQHGRIALAYMYVR